VCSYADHIVESGQFDGAQKRRLKKRFGLAFSTVKAAKLLKGFAGRIRARTWDPMFKSRGEQRGRRSKSAITIESSRPKTNLGMPDGSYVVAKKIPSSESAF
jgi:hypothetical protein